METTNVEITNNRFRQQIKTVSDIAKYALNLKIRNEETFLYLVFQGILSMQSNSEFYNFAGKFAELLKQRDIITQGFMEAVMIMDLYIALNKKYVFNESNKTDEKILNRIIECVEKDDDNKYQRLFIDPKIDALLVKSTLDFLDLSGYDKVLLFKCLSYDDIVLLSKISPLFKEDFEKYSVDINRKFLIRHIDKWKNNHDEAESIYAACDFLINAFKVDIDIEELVVEIINHAGTEEVMQALVDENRDLLSVFVLAYYKEYKKDAPKLK